MDQTMIAGEMDVVQVNSAFAAPLKKMQLRLSEKFWIWLLRILSFFSVVTTVAIIGVLFAESAQFFEAVSFREFVFGLQWSPLIEPRSFGVLPIFLGTLLISFGALVISVPIGLGGAFFLAEYASPRVRKTLKPIIELLAGIPSVVFGYFAINSVTPMLQKVFPATEIFNAASAAIVLGLMVLPMIVSLGDDAIRSVPQGLRHAAFALGATKGEVCRQVLLPASLSGIFAAMILAFSRAVGETMAVSLAAGSTPRLTMNPLESVQTMTSYIVQVALGDVPHGTIEYQSIFAVALVLFAMTLAMNLLSRVVLKKYQVRFDGI